MNIKKIATIGVVALLVLIALVMVFQAVQFHVVSTNPVDGFTKAKAYEPITVDFSQPVKAGSSYSITPQVSGKLTTSGSRVTFTPDQYFSVGTKYTFTLSHVVSQKGSVIKQVSTEFTVVLTPYSQLPAAVKQQYLSQTDAQADAQTPKGKLIQSLPYTTANFSLSYQTLDGTFAVQITSQSLSQDQIKAQVEQYFNQFGVNPNDETINYSQPAAFSGQPGP